MDDVANHLILNDAEQEQYRQAYLQQLRRMSCPGCGVDQGRNSMRVRLDQAKLGAPRVVYVSMAGKTTNYVSLGYAATTHMMQGQTTDYAYVLLGGGMPDNAITYTQLTRGKHATRLYGDRESFDGDLRELYNAMNRDRTTTMSHQQTDSQKHTL